MFEFIHYHPVETLIIGLPLLAGAVALAVVAVRRWRKGGGA